MWCTGSKRLSFFKLCYTVQLVTLWAVNLSAPWFTEVQHREFVFYMCVPAAGSVPEAGLMLLIRTKSSSTPWLSSALVV